MFLALCPMHAVGSHQTACAVGATGELGSVEAGGDGAPFSTASVAAAGCVCRGRRARGCGLSPHTSLHSPHATLFPSLVSSASDIRWSWFSGVRKKARQVPPVRNDVVHRVYVRAGKALAARPFPGSARTRAQLRRYLTRLSAACRPPLSSLFILHEMCTLMALSWHV